MATAGNSLLTQMEETLEFVIDNLKMQYFIPYCATGSCKQTYTLTDDISSALNIIIKLKNLDKCTCDDFSCGANDNLNMLSLIAKQSVDFDLEKDNKGDDADFNLYFFGCNASHTINKMIDICGNNFMICVTYERSYKASDPKHDGEV